MAHEKANASRTSDAMNVVPRRASAGANAQLERRTEVDPRTHARTVYQRGQDGSEMYASYYNSNDDPEFQRRHNRDGSGGAFVQSMQFSYVSNGSALPPQQPSQSRRRQRPTSTASPTVVEVADEEDGKPVYDYDLGDEHREDAHQHPGRRTRAARSSKTTTTRQPIVEEPDEEDGSDGAGDARHTTREHRRASRPNRDREERDAGRAYRGTYAPFASADPFGMDAMMSNMMFPSSVFSAPAPLSGGAPAQPRQSGGRGDVAVANRNCGNSGGMMGGPYAQDFFGPDSPFRMMEAMHYHMQQQRAAMFGGRDPFANFF